MRVRGSDKCYALVTLTMRRCDLSKRRDLSGLSHRGDRDASFQAGVHLEPPARADPISLLERRVNNRAVTGRFTEQ